jgi:hypothetical protein
MHHDRTVSLAGGHQYRVVGKQELVVRRRVADFNNGRLDD